jgi:hypothetical protein
MGRSSPDPDPALAVGDDLKSAADHPSSDNSPQVHPGPHPPNSADGTYTAYSTEVVDVEAKTLEEELGIDEPPATTGSAEETTQHS